MERAKTSCCHTKIAPHKKVKSYKYGGFLSFLSTVFLILIPKCPLCIMAYTSAFLLFFDVEHSVLYPFLLHVKPVLAFSILAFIAFNNRGKRTLVSLIIASVAFIALLLANYWNLIFLPDWILYSVFFFAAWYNGNFQYFFRFIRFKQV